MADSFVNETPSLYHIWQNPFGRFATVGPLAVGCHRLYIVSLVVAASADESAWFGCLIRCRAGDTCRLHHYAALYHCDAHRFQGSGRRFEGRVAGDRVVLEPGKCILCGICVQLAGEASDAAGLAYLGRSMECRIGPPPGVTLDQALGSAARRCAQACPTGAIHLI